MNKIPVTLVIEDDLSLVVVRKIFSSPTCRYSIARVLPEKGRKSAARGNTYIFKKIEALNRAAEAGEHHYVVLTDLDSRECAPAFTRALLPAGSSRFLLLQIAVREIESWLIADRNGFASFLSVASELVSVDPEAVDNPKNHVCELAKKPRKRAIRDEVPPRSPSAAIGPGYNSILAEFVLDHWNLSEASSRSPSLSRFIARSFS